MLGDEVPYDLWGAMGSTGFYSTLYQVSQYNEMSKRILGADFNWFVLENKKLMISPKPNGGTIFLEYKTAVTDITVLTERDHDFIKRYALMWVKKDVGRIRSKYDSMPSAQGRVTLDGVRLLMEAEEELKVLNKEIWDTAVPIPFVVG